MISNIYSILSSNNDLDPGFIPLSNTVSARNEFVNIAVEAREIFYNIAERIRLAKYEINMTFFVWNADSDSCKLIGEAIRQNPNHPIVRILIPEPKYIKNKFMNQLYQTLVNWETEDLQLYILSYAGMGAWHTKFITIDNQISIITGANVQSLFDYTKSTDKNWLDISIILRGQLTSSLNLYFQEMLKVSDRLKCHDIDLFSHQTNFPESILPINLSPLNHISTCETTMTLVPNKLLETKSFANGNLSIMILSKLPTVNPYLDLYSSYQNVADQAIILALLLAKELVQIITPNLNDPVILEVLNHVLSNSIKLQILTDQNFNYLTSKYVQPGTNSQILLSLIDQNQEAYHSGQLQIKYFSYDGVTPVYDHDPHANHAKAIFIDKEYSIVGSQNLDQQSFQASSELGILIQDLEITKIVKNKVWYPNWNKSIPLEVIYD